jgi:exonuclease III
MRIEKIVSDEEYRAWNEEYKKTQPKSSYGKRIDYFPSPAQIQYVDTNRTQIIPQMNYWMLTLPVLVLAVVLIGGRK